jgi:hypothetical protein
MMGMGFRKVKRFESDQGSTRLVCRVITCLTSSSRYGRERLYECEVVRAGLELPA